MDNKKLDTPNDINIVVSTKENGVVLDENCCTVVTTILTNDGKIATSFLGSHNDFILSQITKAQNKYFKALKKKLKSSRKSEVIKPTPSDLDNNFEQDNSNTNQHKTYNKDEVTYSAKEN